MRIEMDTLLVATPETTWREWIKSHRGTRDLLVLDPANPNYGTPGRIALVRGDKTVAWRFVGTVDPVRNPLGVLAAVASMSRQLGENSLGLLFEYRSSPVLRHLALAVAQLLRPREILVPDRAGTGGLFGDEVEEAGWPVGPQKVILDASFPEVVRVAQRRARWIELLERAECHEVLLDRVALEGAKLGSGSALSTAALMKAGLSAVRHAERFGSTAFLVADHDLGPEEMAGVLDLTHVASASVVQSDSYDGLLCSFADQGGDDFGLGVIQHIDWEHRKLIVRCTAVPPAPVRIVRLGTLRIDSAGQEAGEVRPWSV